MATTENTIYCWGNTLFGEVGPGGVEDELLLEPHQMSWWPNEMIVGISCGRYHTLFLTASGKVYSCGNNDNDQLGHNIQTKRPQLLTDLEHNAIVQVVCGANYSVALNEWGQVFSWGNNYYGQLGLCTLISNVSKPKLIKKLLTKNIVQVACGINHSMALSNCGEVYTWGSNVHGQLGIGENTDVTSSNVPILLQILHGIPIAFVACGGNHCFVITVSGAVYGWGRNNCGQLGLNDKIERKVPTQLKTMRSLGVRYIACGDEFSAFLTIDGGVFTCGNGNDGQLGHATNTNEVLPRMIMELMGSTITQIACGCKHTMALESLQGRLYSFGLGSSGQLGVRSTDNYALPQLVPGPWTAGHFANLMVMRLYCGGDASLVTTVPANSTLTAVDYRTYDKKTQILQLTSDFTLLCSLVKKETPLDVDLLITMKVIFPSQACINASFLLLYGGKHQCCTSKQHGVDLVEAKKAFDNLRQPENDEIRRMILNMIFNLMISLNPTPIDYECLRVYITLPLYHEFENTKNYMKLHTQFSNAIGKLDDNSKKMVLTWWAATPLDYFEHLVSNYLNVVAHIITFQVSQNTVPNIVKQLLTYNGDLMSAINLLVILHDLNHNKRKEKLHYEAFHWPELAEYVDVQQEYIVWFFDKNPDSFNICNYPFLFDATAKTSLLQTDQAIQMHRAMQLANINSILPLVLSRPTNAQFIFLNVSRDNLVQDTLREITKYTATDLKKPLKIKFIGEEAEDGGGVSKEFFMLLLKDLIDPKYGMFREYDDPRALWFAEQSFESDDMYFLVGVICGLAIYNFTIINLPFPLALYKKLLNDPVDLSDLRDISPSLANSMQCILNYNESDFEAVFDLHFEITREIFGQPSVALLKPNGDNIAVNQENKEEFVNLYIDFIFNKSVKTQFMAFQNGFMKVCWGRVLQLFKPKELMDVVVGNQEYDWATLENNCDYKNGYTARDQTIKWFWDVFHQLTQSEKIKFLLFLTGSDRIPIQGMKAVKISIQPTEDERFLPVAHTCFNLLDLPRYRTKECLKYKLLQAVQQTQGFSLV